MPTSALTQIHVAELSAVRRLGEPSKTDQSASQEGHTEDTDMALTSSKSQTAPQNVVVGLCVLVLEITGHSRAPTRNGEEGVVYDPSLVSAGWSGYLKLGF